MSTITFIVVSQTQFKTLSRRQQTAVFSLVLFKASIALSMGHLDISRFIIFLQNFVQHPLANPWDFKLTAQNVFNSIAGPTGMDLQTGLPMGLQNGLQSDFPYPPLLMYLHSIPFFIKNILIQNSELGLKSIDYMLIRWPLLMTDAFVVRHLIKTRHAALFLYLGSPLLLFHQFYSGQLDLIAAVPFFLGLHFLNLKNWRSAFLFIALSLCLKPFAVLFFPFLVLLQKDFRTSLKTGLLLLLTLLLFKISELPYALTPSYVEKMGAGAKVLLEPSFIKFYLSLLLVLLFLRWKQHHFFLKHQEILQYGCVFTASAFIGELEYHSAGWMVWPFLALVFSFRNQKIIPQFLIWLWGASFIIRWSFIDHSPLLDSFDVFLRNYTHATNFYGMGFPYHYLTSHFSSSVAELFLTISFRQYEAMTTLLILLAGYRLSPFSRRNQLGL